MKVESFVEGPNISHKYIYIGNSTPNVHPVFFQLYMNFVMCTISQYTAGHHLPLI